MRASEVRFYTIREGDALDFTALLGGNAKITEGWGGWGLQRRRRRTSAVVWNGRSPFQMTLPLIIDNFRENTSIESTISELERMGLPTEEFRGPPRIRIQGAAVPKTELDWVIENIEETACIRNHNGNRVRYEAIVTLRSFVDIQLTQSKPKNSTAAGGSTRTYVVKKGDKSLATIAAKLLGKATRWREIGRLNNIRDPKKIHVGQRLKVPRN